MENVIITINKMVEVEKQISNLIEVGNFESNIWTGYKNEDSTKLDNLWKEVYALCAELKELCLNNDSIYMSMLKVVTDEVNLWKINKDRIIEPIMLLDLEDSEIEQEEDTECCEVELTNVSKEEINTAPAPNESAIRMFIEPTETLKAKYSGKNSLKTEAAKILYRYNKDWIEEHFRENSNIRVPA